MPPARAASGPPAGAWVPETRFGEWFQRTDVWRRYVVDEAIAELAALLPPGASHFGRVLDAGCGEGVAFPALRARFGAAELHGIDINPAAVRAAGPAAAAVGATVAVADATRLPMGSASQDLVVCHQLLHHAVDPAAVLAELRRVLRPGGWLLVAESCAEFLEWWPVRLLFRHPVRDQHSPEGYADLIVRAGFELEPARVCTPTPWWSLRDLGLRSRWQPGAPPARPTQVRIAARRPLAGSDAGQA